MDSPIGSEEDGIDALLKKGEKGRCFAVFANPIKSPVKKGRLSPSCERKLAGLCLAYICFRFPAFAL